MGVIEAQGDKEARQHLRGQGFIVTSLNLKRNISRRQNLKGDNLIAFTVQLSQLINAGIPLYESLIALEEQSRGDPYHSVILSICEQIKGGASLSVAMGNHSESFDKLYCGMVAAGEAVGALGSVLEKLSTFLARTMKLKKQITTALIYPAILGGFSCLIIGVLLGFVIPALEGIFADRKLNAFTNTVLVVSWFFRTYWWIYLPIMIGSITFIVWKMKTEEGRLWRERLSLKIPLLRTLVIQTAVARFCRTMATLLQGGLNMIESLQISRTIMRNVVLEEEIKTAEARIVEGRRLSQELKKSRYYPPLVSRMLAVGEDSGTSVVMLSRIADMYESEIEKTLDRLMALAQPLILIVMGLVIGSVLLAILLPLTDVSSFSVG